MATLDPLHDEHDISSSVSSVSSNVWHLLQWFIMWIMVTIIYYRASHFNSLFAVRDGHWLQLQLMVGYVIIWWYISYHQWLLVDASWYEYQRWWIGVKAKGDRNVADPYVNYILAMYGWVLVDTQVRIHFSASWFYIVIMRVRDTYRPWCTSYERVIYRSPWYTLMVVPIVYGIIYAMVPSLLVGVTPLNIILDVIRSSMFAAGMVQFSVTRWSIKHRETHIRRAMTYYASGGTYDVQQSSLPQQQNHHQGASSQQQRILSQSPNTDAITSLLMNDTLLEYGIIRPLSQLIASYCQSAGVIKQSHYSRSSRHEYGTGMILDIMNDDVTTRLATELWISRHRLDRAIAIAGFVPHRTANIVVPSIAIPLQLCDDPLLAAASSNSVLQLRLPVRLVTTPPPPPASRVHHNPSLVSRLISRVRNSGVVELGGLIGEWIVSHWTPPKHRWSTHRITNYMGGERHCFELDTSSCQHVRSHASQIERNWSAITHLQHWLRTPMTDITLASMLESRRLHEHRVHHDADPTNGDVNECTGVAAELPIRVIDPSISPIKGALILYVNVTLQCDSATNTNPIYHTDDVVQPYLCVADMPWRLTFDAAYAELPLCCINK